MGTGTADGEISIYRDAHILYGCARCDLRERVPSLPCATNVHVSMMRITPTYNVISYSLITYMRPGSGTHFIITVVRSICGQSQF
jgi:hypothetical protein